MVDIFSPEKRSSVMSAIRSKDTKPEILVRSALHQLGYRFRLHIAGLPGKPDVVLPRYAIAIQVRGCFWHGHTCADGHLPKTRQEYWKPKLAANKTRDRRNDAKLRKAGWTVIVIWACRVNSEKKLASTITRVQQAIEKSKLKSDIG